MVKARGATFTIPVCESDFDIKLVILFAAFIAKGSRSEGQSLVRRHKQTSGTMGGGIRPWFRVKSKV